MISFTFPHNTYRKDTSPGSYWKRPQVAQISPARLPDPVSIPYLCNKGLSAFACCPSFLWMTVPALFSLGAPAALTTFISLELLSAATGPSTDALTTIYALQQGAPMTLPPGPSCISIISLDFFNALLEFMSCLASSAHSCSFQRSPEVHQPLLQFFILNFEFLYRFQYCGTERKIGGHSHQTPQRRKHIFNLRPPQECIFGYLWQVYVTNEIDSENS